MITGYGVRDSGNKEYPFELFGKQNNAGKVTTHGIALFKKKKSANELAKLCEMVNVGGL